MIAFLLLFTYFLLNYYNDDKHLWYDFLEFFVLFQACVAVSVVTIINYKRGGIAFIDFREFAKKKLDQYFKEVNKKVYRERGLKWRCPLKGHYWIELQISEEAAKLGKRLRFLKTKTLKN